MEENFSWGPQQQSVLRKLTARNSGTNISYWLPTQTYKLGLVSVQGIEKKETRASDGNLHLH